MRHFELARILLGRQALCGLQFRGDIRAAIYAMTSERQSQPVAFDRDYVGDVRYRTNCVCAVRFDFIEYLIIVERRASS